MRRAVIGANGAWCLHGRAYAHQRRQERATGHHHVTGTAKRLERRIEVVTFADVFAKAREILAGLHRIGRIAHQVGDACTRRKKQAGRAGAVHIREPGRLLGQKSLGYRAVQVHH